MSCRSLSFPSTSGFLLHVCRPWRAVALSTPGLWADLNENTKPHPHWDLAISRPGTLSLSLTFNPKSISNMDIFASVIRQSSQRIGLLFLVDYDESHGNKESVRLLNTFFSDPLPSLRELILGLHAFQMKDSTSTCRNSRFFPS
jgi:hypothetical protein